LKSKVLVLGGGQQGSVIAAELATDVDVDVADRRPVQVPGARWVDIDAGDVHGLVEKIRHYDLVVGALPAALGFEAAKAAIKAGVSYVDVAFYAEDAHELDAAAKDAGVMILPDCGLAPGLSHMLAGRAMAARERKRVCIYVGGVARNPDVPFGYVLTWSPEDLADEYVRPARILRQGKVETVPALSGVERIDIEGVGEMEAFYTDGVRTLLSAQGVPDIEEKTLRWPGHIEAIAPLLKDGSLISTLHERCSTGEDLVVLRVEADEESATLIEVARGGLSAMARTTALTTAAFARLVLSGALEGRTGVLTPEDIGSDVRAYQFVLASMAKHGVCFAPSQPFS